MKSEKQIGTILLSLLFIQCGSSSDLSKGTSANSNIPVSEKTLCAGANAEKTDGYGGGDGTQGNPYLICTNEQFKGIHGTRMGCHASGMAGLPRILGTTPRTTPGPPLRHWTANVRGAGRAGSYSDRSRTTSVPPSTSASEAPSRTTGPSSRTVMTTTFSLRVPASATAACIAGPASAGKRRSDADAKQPDVPKNWPRPSAAAASLAATSF